MREKVWRDKIEIDQIIRRTMNLGMDDGPPKLVIEYVYGFEKFGSYETWAGGYRIVDHKHQLVVERADLDNAVRFWAALVGDLQAGVTESSKSYRKTYELNYTERK